MRRGSAPNLPTPAILASAALLCACGPPSVWRGTSPDHRTRYVVAERDGLTCIEVDDRSPRCYDGLSLGDITFAPDSRRLAFPAREGDSWRVVVDDESGPPVDAVGEILFDPSGRRVAYAARRGDAWHVVSDGAFGPAVDHLFAGSLQFDSDGRRLAYAGRAGEEARVYLDDRLVARHEGVGTLRFAAGDDRLGYVARDGGRAHLFVGRSRIATHPEILDFRFGDDGALAWLSRDSAGSRVHWRDRDFGPFPSVEHLTLGRDHPPIFVVRQGGVDELRFGDRVVATHRRLDAPVIRGDDDRWGVIGSDSTESTVTLNGTIVARETWAAGLALGPAGRFAYTAARAGLTYVVHDRGERGFDVVVPESLVFLDGTGRWAGLVGDLDREALYVVVEGVTVTRPFDWSEAGRLLMRDRGGAFGGAAMEGLRAWVRAEAMLILESGAR